MSDPVNAYPMLRKAAFGEVQAMRDLAALCSKQAAQEGDWVAMLEGLVFSRLAYARSGEKEDAGLQLTCLALASEMTPDPDAQFTWHAESIALVSRMADAGVALADEHFNSVVESADGETVQAAKEIANLMAEEGL